MAQEIRVDDITEKMDSNDDIESSEATKTPQETAPTETDKASGDTEEKLDAGAKALLDEQESETVDDADIERVVFKVVFCKKKYDVNLPLDSTIIKLKQHLHGMIGVPPDMQKVMIKGLAPDSKSLRELGVTPGAKVMVVGTKLEDVVSVSPPTPEELAAGQSSSKEKESLCSQTVHRKVLDKGIPDDVLPGIKGVKEPLPQVPLSGMLNKQGRKVRLTFKLEMDQLWIGTQQRTEKISMNSIKGVVSEPITGHEQYHMLAIQLGPTEASRYWIYWVPAQYVDAIKDAILGKWQYF